MRNQRAARSIKPISALTCAYPLMFFDFHADNGISAYSSVSNLSALTAGGTPDFATRKGWLNLDGASFYTFDTYLNTALASVLNLGENAILVWAQVNNLLAGPTRHSLINAGFGTSFWRVTLLEGTGFRHSVSIAHDGDGGETEYAGSADDFNEATDTNIAILIDNREGVKGSTRWVNGAQVAGESWAGKGACTYASASAQRTRLFASSASSPANIAQGANRRLGVVNFGTTVPANIDQIALDLHNNNSLPTRSLLEA